MASENGWPDPQRPGVPLNPGRDGWHWVRANKTEIGEWSSKDQAWAFADDDDMNSAMWIGRVCGYRYLGPCLLPSEVAAQVAAARRAGVEEALGAVGEVGTSAPNESGIYWQEIALDEAETAIRALLEEPGA